MSAWELKKNQKGIVAAVQPTVNARARALGLLPGCVITCVHRGASGGVYGVCQLRIYLQKGDAVGVMLR